MKEFIIHYEYGAYKQNIVSCPVKYESKEKLEEDFAYAFVEAKALKDHTHDSEFMFDRRCFFLEDFSNPAYASIDKVEYIPPHFFTFSEWHDYLMKEPE